MTKKEHLRNTCCYTCGIPIRSSTVPLRFCSDACEEVAVLRLSVKHGATVHDRQRGKIRELEQRLADTEESIMHNAPSLVHKRHACVVWETADAPVAFRTLFADREVSLIAEIPGGSADEMTLGSLLGFNRSFVTEEHPVNPHYVLVGVNCS